MSHQTLNASPAVPLRLLAALMLSGALALTGCGGGSDAGTTAAPETAQEEEAPAPLTEDEVKQWLDGVDSFVGRQATVTGQVFNTEHDGDLHSYQIYTDPDNYEGNTIIQISGENPGISNEDFIRATGTIEENFTGENAFGGEVTATAMTADTIEKVTYQEAVAPTLTQVDLSLAAETSGYSVTIDKIEFAEKETRVYVTLSNNGAGRFSMFDQDAVIIQDGQQYNVQDNYLAGYPSINNELAQGASMSGIICFPHLEAKNMQIQMHGFSDNYEVDPPSLDYTFDITIE